MEKKIEIEGEGLLAQAIAHEIDHLEGILFIDKVIPGNTRIFNTRRTKIGGM